MTALQSYAHDLATIVNQHMMSLPSEVRMRVGVLCIDVFGAIMAEQRAHTSGAPLPPAPPPPRGKPQLRVVGGRA